MAKCKIEDVISEYGAKLENGAILKFIGGNEFELLTYGSNLNYYDYYGKDPAYQEYGNIYRINNIIIGYNNNYCFLAIASELGPHDFEKCKMSSIIEGLEGLVIEDIKSNPVSTGFIFRVNLYDLIWQSVK